MSGQTRCLETRRRQGMKWRRYKTPEGVTFTTFEVPAQVVGLLGVARLKEELERAERTLERKTRNHRALALLARGWKTTAVAHEVGLCDSQVRRIKQHSKGAK